MSTHTHLSACVYTCLHTRRGQTNETVAFIRRVCRADRSSSPSTHSRSTATSSSRARGSFLHQTLSEPWAGGGLPRDILGAMGPTAEKKKRKKETAEVVGLKVRDDGVSSAWAEWPTCSAPSRPPRSLALGMLRKKLWPLARRG